MSNNNYVVILDCETATIPLTRDIAKNEKELKLLNIARPIIYDIGWVIYDLDERKIIRTENYLIQETFFVPVIFNTAYYRDKRPFYIDKINKKEIKVGLWSNVLDELQKDIENANYTVAYNAMFDLKKAIPFTEEYFENLSSAHYKEWEDTQRKICRGILTKKKSVSKKEFDNLHFTIRGKDYVLKCLWGLSCKLLIDKDEYRDFCLGNGLVSESGLFFKTTAETCYRFLEKKYNFEESHTALEDALIETKIFEYCLEKTSNLEDGIIFFPFNILGKTTSFIYRNDIKGRKVEVVKNSMYEKIKQYKFTSPFSQKLERNILELEEFSPSKKKNKGILEIKLRSLKRDLLRIVSRMEKLDIDSLEYYKYYTEAERKMKKLEQLLEKGSFERKLHIYYHKEDFDGEMSGAVIDFLYDKNFERVWHPCAYDKTIEFEDIGNKDVVFVADLNLEGESLKNLEGIARKNKRVYWCDHHPSSVEYKGKIKGYRDSSMSGVALSYLFLTKKIINEKNFNNLPLSVKLVSDFDIWSFKFKETWTFHCAMLGEETDPRYINNIWSKLLSGECNPSSFTKNGVIISKYLDINNRKNCEEMGYVTTFEGLSTFCINLPKVNFGENKKKYDLCVSWHYIGNGLYQYSLRTDKEYVNCKEIAEKYGGGGHIKASGFVIDKQLFF